jgi:hypothetical protein
MKEAASWVVDETELESLVQENSIDNATLLVISKGDHQF